MDRRAILGGLAGLVLSGCSDYDIVSHSRAGLDGSDVLDTGLLPVEDEAYVEPNEQNQGNNSPGNGGSVEEGDPACFSYDPACISIENTLSGDGRYHMDDMSNSPVEFNGRLPLRLGDFINGSRSDAYLSCVSSDIGLTACVSEDFLGSPYLVFSDGEEDDSIVHFGIPYSGRTEVLDVGYLGQGVFTLGYVRGNFPEGTIPYDSLQIVDAQEIIENPSIVETDQVNGVLFKRMGQFFYDSGDSIDSDLMDQVDSRSMPDDGRDYVIMGTKIPLGDSGQYFASVGLIPDYVDDAATLGTDGTFNVGGLETSDLPELGIPVELFYWE